MIAYTYILKLNNGSYYVGSTRNIKNRIIKHNKGSVTTTKNKRPVKLVYKEEHLTYKKALERELQIKKWKKRRAIENLISRIGPIV